MSPHSFFFFFFNDTATTEIYTLSLHDALPILLSALQTALFELGLKPHQVVVISGIGCSSNLPGFINTYGMHTLHRSEEHTSELQSLRHLVCRLLLEKKKKKV